MMLKLEFFPRVLSKIVGVWGGGARPPWKLLSSEPRCANALPMPCPHRRDPLLYPSSNLQYRTMQKQVDSLDSILTRIEDQESIRESRLDSLGIKLDPRHLTLAKSQTRNLQVVNYSQSIQLSQKHYCSIKSQQELFDSRLPFLDLRENRDSKEIARYCNFTVDVLIRNYFLPDQNSILS